jgi:hypothetical protein
LFIAGQKQIQGLNPKIQGIMGLGYAEENIKQASIVLSLLPEGQH